MTHTVEISVAGMMMSHIIHVGQLLGNGVTVPQLFQVDILTLQIFKFSSYVQAFRFFRSL